jgi:hypothetical protein
VRREECPERLGFARPESGGGAQELQELLASVDWKAVRGMSDNVGVDMIGKMEADGDPARAGLCRVVVGDRGDAGGVRIADGHGRGWPVRVRGAGQPGRLGRRAERAHEHKTLGVGWPKACVHSSRELIEHAEQVRDEWRRHDSFLRRCSVWKAMDLT